MDGQRIAQVRVDPIVETEAMRKAAAELDQAQAETRL
jgi:hypothetical protein